MRMACPKSLGVCATLLLLCLPVAAKVHSVALGGWRKVPYTAPTTSTPSPDEPTSLRVRPLVVDGQVKDWTTGEIHEITDRTFVARRAVKLNDALPNEAGAHWLWVLGPWLLVDRSSAHISVLHLPDFDPAVSEIVWFRDYAAYCGVNTTGNISTQWLRSWECAGLWWPKPYRNGRWTITPPPPALLQPGSASRCRSSSIPPTAQPSVIRSSAWHPLWLKRAKSPDDQ